MITETERILSLFAQDLDQSVEQQAYTQAKLAFLDVLFCQMVSRDNDKVKSLASYYGLGNTWEESFENEQAWKREQAALLTGLAAHFEDFDDVQANLRGHGSAVIYSALLSVASRTDTLSRLFDAYIKGLEFAAQIGKQVHPQHAERGYHSTATLGILGACFAIASFKKLSARQSSYLLSFAANQASGLLIQEGSDGKPLNAGLAASKAVQSYHLVTAGLESIYNPFVRNKGWQKAFGFDIDWQVIQKDWLQGPQILQPGLWFKKEAFCSAGTAAFDAAQQLVSQGIAFDAIEKVSCHFTQTGDLALMHQNPKTKLEGKFSAEYIVWLGLTKTSLSESDFSDQPVSAAFRKFALTFTREHDLTDFPPHQRPTKLEVTLKNQQKISVLIEDPKGSPNHPLTLADFDAKWQPVFKQSSTVLLDYLSTQAVTLSDFKQFLRGE